MSLDKQSFLERIEETLFNIAYTKLGLKPKNETKTIEFNDQTIEVKQYLPVEEKLGLIGRVLELSHEQNNFSNPVKT